MARRPLPEHYRVGRPIAPNKGLEVAYRQKLERLIDEMYGSILWWIGAEYKKQQDRIFAYDPGSAGLASDASPANAMLAAIHRRFRQWRRNFDEKANDFADWFSNRAKNSATSATGQSVGQALGITVKFRPTRAMQNAMASIVNENVALIKSIPQKYFLELEGLVMRSVRAGRDIGRLTDELEKRYKVVRNRAAFIARDQNNKATEALSRVRMQELGFSQAKWIHVTRSNNPRHTHVEMDGKIFDLKQGMFDQAVGQWIQPGELPNCRCQKAPVLSMLYDNNKLKGEYE